MQEEAFQWRDLDISVLTNSDYIMEKMLKNSKVSNVSGSYLSENKKELHRGYRWNWGIIRLFLVTCSTKVKKWTTV